MFSVIKEKQCNKRRKKMYALNLPRMFYDMMDNHAIIIDSGTGNYYLLNILASKAFFYLTRGASPSELVTVLSKVSGCPEDIQKRIEDFCTQLVNEEILNIGEWEKFNGETDAGDFWFSEGIEFKMEKYGDMADLIAADPIHDVDEEYGWPILKEE
jgi:hypothetical protein